ncbi:hypothetical protein D3C84_1272970 [compost metagenome]
MATCNFDLPLRGTGSSVGLFELLTLSIANAMCAITGSCDAVFPVVSRGCKTGAALRVAACEVAAWAAC